MKPFCRKTGIIALISALCAGCTNAIVTKTIDSSQTYQGYPCGNQCGEFQTGFDTALKKQIISEAGCYDLNQNYQTGCRSYVYEYHLEHDQPAGYSFASEVQNVN